MTRIKALVIGTFVAIFLAGCVSSTPPKPLERQLSPGFSAAQVEKAILAAGKSRKWNMKKTQNGVITGSIIVREANAEIRIPFNAKQYSIEYVGSKAVTADGPQVPRNYTRWATMLDKSIQNELAKMR